MQKIDFRLYRLGQIFSIVWILCLCLGIAPNVSQAATVGSSSFVWYDAARNRSIPVKIFYPANSEEKLPIIVFSHGLGGAIDCCSYLGTAWASRGFVAVFLQHPGSDENVWKGKILILSELRESYQYNWNGRTRALDIRFAVDRLEQLAAEKKWFADKLDLDRIGVGGYDLGALASLLVAGQVPPDQGKSLYDPRIKAVLAMSPPVNNSGKSYRAVYDPIDVPVFFITGTEDDGIIGTTKAYQRRIPFDSMSRNNRYLVVFRGGDHRIYGGHSFSLLARNDKQFQSAIVRSSSCFWQAVLQENPEYQAALNDRSLNSMLGGIASVERRFGNVDVLTRPQKLEELKSSEESENLVIPIIQEKAAPSIESFPVSRFYRNVIQSQVNGQ